MPLHKLARGSIIVDDQDQGLISLLHRAERLRMGLHHERLIGLRHARQLDREGRSPTRITFDGYVAAHHLTKAAADRETKTCSAVLSGCCRGSLRKLLEK